MRSVSGRKEFANKSLGMEFPLGRRDQLYLIRQDREEEKQQQLLEFSKRPSPFTVSAVASSSSSAGFGWQRDGRDDGAGDGCSPVEKEHMFDKVVTPSDVGKLNRLVIPKHHAEKYFPLDASANEKGLLLCFEDRAGKAWRFRYSYWNSSQSYVMTKGWSRFVKEKGLSAGNTVSFGRGIGDAARHRLFIDWRKRRPDPTTTLDAARFTVPLPGPWSSRIFLPPLPAVACGYNWQGRAGGYGTTAAVGGGQLLYYKLPAARPPEMVGVQQLGSHGIPMLPNSVPQVEQNQVAAVAKRVRLFGVNLDSPESGSGSVGLFHPRTTTPLAPLLHHPQAASGSSSSSSSSSASKEQQQQYSPFMRRNQRRRRRSIDRDFFDGRGLE